MLRQPFHLVEPRPWPLTGSFGAFFIAMGLVFWFHGKGIICLVAGLILVIITIIQWWRDVIREGTFLGFHTRIVESGLRYGIIMFILSEVCFFFSFFWAFFHSSLAPTIELGCIWPPVGIYPLDAFTTPLLNTCVLLFSGVTVTWSHFSIIEGSRKESIHRLIFTVVLGIYFTFLQLGEYIETSFTVADSVYGSVFFVATGFHGLHVIIGSVFLAVCLYRIFEHQMRRGRHSGFEAAAWYWHFVDVVWIFLYLWVYWWGSL